MLAVYTIIYHCIPSMGNIHISATVGFVPKYQTVQSNIHVGPWEPTEMYDLLHCGFGLSCPIGCSPFWLFFVVQTCRHVQNPDRITDHGALTLLFMSPKSTSQIWGWKFAIRCELVGSHSGLGCWVFCEIRPCVLNPLTSMTTTTVDVYVYIYITYIYSIW